MQQPSRRDTQVGRYQLQNMSYFARIGIRSALDCVWRGCVEGKTVLMFFTAFYGSILIGGGGNIGVYTSVFSQ